MSPIKNRKTTNSAKDVENAVAIPTPIPITNGEIAAIFLPNLKKVMLNFSVDVALHPPGLPV